MNTPEPAFEHQLQQALAQIMQADNQCMECGVYRIDGGVPQLHQSTCESSGTAPYYRRMSAPEMPPWVEQGHLNYDTGQWWRVTEQVTDYGPGYDLEGDDS